jgi:hypothetical protein
MFNQISESSLPQTATTTTTPAVLPYFLIGIHSHALIYAKLIESSVAPSIFSLK